MAPLKNIYIIENGKWRFLSFDIFGHALPAKDKEILHMTGKKSKFTTAILFFLLLMFSMTGCMEKKYKVDYDETFFSGKKQAYRPGEEAEFVLEVIGSDMNTAIYLDGEWLPSKYDENRGYIVRFTMPEHDVKLTVEYIPDFEP